MRLLQETQSSGYNLKAEELERFYKLFGCNTTLIRKENRHSTIHKICRYIEREGSDYRVGKGRMAIAGDIPICNTKKGRISEKSAYKTALKIGLII